MSKVEFAELFLADNPAVETDEEGLIWKPMLPVGIWKVGPNGRPLKVVAGSYPDPRSGVVGLKDIKDAFDEGAIAHVTIPKTHNDEVDENTGQIKKVDIRNHDGVPTLFGGHDFTDQGIKQKVVDGSIINTSVGLEFDYVRKTDGKLFPIILRHNALTNRPWLGSRLAPFGVIAGESDDDYEVHSFQFSEPLAESGDKDVLLAELCVMIKDGDVKTLAELVQAISDGMKNYEGDNPTSTATYILPNAPKEPMKMSDQPTGDGTETPTAPPENPFIDHSKIDLSKLDLTKVDLSEHPQFKEANEKNARLTAKLSQLSAAQRERDTDDFVTELKAIGFDEQHGCTGFLKKVRSILLSDEGDTALLLAEDGGDTPRPITAANLVRELLSELPKQDGKLAIQLSEQHTDPLHTSGSDKPPATGGDEEDDPVKLSEKISAADTWFEQNFPGASASSN